MRFFTIERLKRFFFQTFIIGLFFAVSVYGWVRILLYDFPFEPLLEAGTLLKMAATGWAMVAFGKASFELIVFMVFYCRRIPMAIQKKKDRGFVAHYNTGSKSTKRVTHPGKVKDHATMELLCH